MIRTDIPCDVVHLLPILDNKLIDLLKSLTRDDWKKQTIAKRWTVKDVAAHLLDGNIRILSMLRDTFIGEQADIRSYNDLVDFLNRLNADWVKAMKRVSPELLIVFHEMTGSLYCNYYKSLDPCATAALAVDWAGEMESKNWMHIAREYTEKWLHQQQIRDATNNPGLLTRELFYPFIDIFMLDLPHTYRAVTADNGTTVKITIPSDIGGSWFLIRTDNKWILHKNTSACPTAELIIDPEMTWKLFSKSIRPEEIRNKVTILGDQKLGETALSMVSVIA